MRILLTTILMLVCIVAYSATPSYSNFSSNQFAPSGTYTVTVKAKAMMTNTVFMGVGTPAVELHGGWLSTNDTSGSITVMSNASTVWSNGVAAGSVAITNAGGIMNLEGGPRGTVLQFRFNTSGTPAMIISNGCVGIGIKPTSGKILSVGSDMDAPGFNIAADTFTSGSGITSPNYNYTTNAIGNPQSLDMKFGWGFTNVAGAVVINDLLNVPSALSKTKYTIFYNASGGDVTLTVPAQWYTVDGVHVWTLTNNAANRAILTVTTYGHFLTNASLVQYRQ